MEKSIVGTVIAIDFGTSYSRVGVYKSSKVDIIADDQGNRSTPSYVAFTADGKRLVGHFAKEQLTSNPGNTIFNMKRLIGRTWDDFSIQDDVTYLPYKVVNSNNKPSIVVNTGGGQKSFSPEEISAMVLGKMKEIAEAYLGHKVANAVITVPSYFNDAQRQATIEAGTIAGLNVIRIINEPTATALTYGMGKKENKNICVFDLGGGFMDVSLLNVDNGVFEVLATNGDTHLGGMDVDQILMHYFISLYKQKGKDVNKDKFAVQKLRREVIKAKHTLSSSNSAQLEIKSFLDGEDFSETLNRAKFEELNDDLLKKINESLRQLMTDCERHASDVDEIVLSGDSTHIPLVQQMLKQFFGGKEPISGINSSEAVVYGAAIQATILSGEHDFSEFLLMDVNPLSIGIETTGGVMTNIVPRNSHIPMKRSQIFSTKADNETSIIIKVFEGELPMAIDNHLTGKFKISGITPALKGVPQIEVTFKLNDNGTLNLTAVDTDTGRQIDVVIKNV